jgi:hypothetical protein
VGASVTTSARTAARARMGTAARVRALERFGHERVGRELAALLARVARAGV